MPASPESISTQLSTLYENALPIINNQIEECIIKCNWDATKVSKPFFMHINEAYSAAKLKVMFVGRETFGWEQYNQSDKAADLTNLYQSVCNKGEHYNSPFWWFRRDFNQAIGLQGNSMINSAWTNLSKIDVDKTTPAGRYFGDLQQYFIGLLVTEINILKPDVVLIMPTNGHYNWHLNNYNWADNKIFTVFDKGSSLGRNEVPYRYGKFYELIAEGLLPRHTYQICHPNVFRRRAGGYKEQAGELIRTLVHRLNQ